MNGCSVCGDENLPRSCNYCGESVCTKHRLPENHSCSRVGDATAPQAPNSKSSSSLMQTMATLASKVIKIVVILSIIVLIGFAFGTMGGGSDAGSSADGASTGWDAEAVETAAFERINEARQQNGLSPLTASSAVADRADRWSRRMAQRGDLFHGKGKCAYSGENVALSYWKERIDTERGERYFDTPAAMGTGLANQWLNSSQHRKNIMRERFATSGIGVVKTESANGNTVVYATQRFCG